MKRLPRFTVYLLLSRSGKTYIGQTANLRRRFREHNAEGNIGWTRGRRWHLISVRHCIDRHSAALLERSLKRRPSWRYSRHVNWEFVRWIRSARSRVRVLCARYGINPTRFHRKGPQRLAEAQPRSHLSNGLAILLRGPSANKGREPIGEWPVTYLVTRGSSNRLLDGAEVQPTLMVYTMAYTDG